MGEIYNELRKDTVSKLIGQGKRIDERGYHDYREIKIEKEVIPNAEGSALAKIGRTQVLVGAKFDMATPYPDRPGQGIFSTSAELSPLAYEAFEPGPPREDSIELARVVDRGIRSAEIIDFESFFIEEGKVLALFIDIYVLDNDGNMFDAAGLAAMAAIASARFPKVEDGSIIRTEDRGNLPVKEKVVPCTFAKIGEKHVLDPTVDEEKAMDSRITIATTPTDVCAGQKGGMGSMTKKDILDLIDISMEKGNELRKLI